MKSMLNKIFQGFLTGLGFSLVLGFTYYYVTQKITENAMSMYSFDDEAVAITEHQKVDRQGKLVILGTVENKGESQAKGIQVIVDLYLNNKFVKQCSESVSGGIPAGEARNFEISCGGGCANNPIVEHDSYKIYVSGY